MREVGVIQVSEHSEELTVYLLCDRREIRLEIGAELGWEVLSILDRLLDPGHDVVNIRRSWQFDLLARRVDPSIIKPTEMMGPVKDKKKDKDLRGPCGHRPTIRCSANFREDSVERIQVCVEIKN